MPTYKGHHYCLIEKDTLPELAESVNNAMSDGWRPVGGIASLGKLDGSHIWVQALTK